MLTRLISSRLIFLNITLWKPLRSFDFFFFFNHDFPTLICFSYCIFVISLPFILRVSVSVWLSLQIFMGKFVFPDSMMWDFLGFYLSKNLNLVTSSVVWGGFVGYYIVVIMFSCFLFWSLPFFWTGYFSSPSSASPSHIQQWTYLFRFVLLPFISWG